MVLPLGAHAFGTAEVRVLSGVANPQQCAWCGLQTRGGFRRQCVFRYNSAESACALATASGISRLKTQLEGLTRYLNFFEYIQALFEPNSS